MTGKRTCSRCRNEEITKLQKRQREIEKMIGAARGNQHASLHDEYQANQRSLGKLMLERDRQERPQIYEGGQHV